MMRNEGEEKLRSLGSNLTKIKKNLQKKRATMARAPPEVGEVATAPVTIVLPDGEVYGTSLKTESAEKSLRVSSKPNPLLNVFVPELEGLWTPSADDDEDATPNRLQAKSRPGAIMAATPTSKMSQKLAEERIKRRRELALRQASKQLLGELHSDKIYLEKLMISPLLKDSKIKHGIMNRRTVHESIVDALDYLDARKDFWQQQKPVYARKIEQNARMDAVVRKRKKKSSV